jgi:hypothetical protein
MTRIANLGLVFVAVLGLVGLIPMAAQADSVDVNNFSFELDGNDNQILGHMVAGHPEWGITLKGWTVSGDWIGVDVYCPNAIETPWHCIDFEPTNGIAACYIQTNDIYIYQILDHDISPGVQYTLTFDAITLNTDADIEPSFFYADPCLGHVELAAGMIRLDPIDPNEPFEWTELSLTITAGFDQNYVGKPLGIKFYSPIPEDGDAWRWIFIDNVRVNSNFVPVACIAGGNHIVEVGSGCEARVTLDGSCSSDEDSTPGTNDDISDFDWYKVDPCDPNMEDFLGSGEIIECNLPLGEHDIVLEVIDKAGAFDTNEVTIIVQDTTPPEFTLSVTPTTLWPPNHKMVEITPSWEASDNCDESLEVTLVSITTNEDDDAKGDGHTTDDIQVDDNGIWLRAERSGKGTGRVYTITYQAADDSGNVTVQEATVTVPHNRRRGK